MFQYNFTEIQAQLDTLSPILRIWFVWLGLVILVLPFVFIRHRQGRVAVIFSLVFIAIQFPLLHVFGIGYFLSLPHLVLWIPLFIYLSRELKAGRIQLHSPFGVWTLIAIATLLVSLVFDIRDFVRWIAGERGLMSTGPGIVFPWFTIPAMLIGFILMGWYLFYPQRTEKTS